MKDSLKLITILLVGAIAAAIPIVGFYFAWSWCMAQVPMVYAWAGLVKIALTLGMVLVGGSITFVMSLYSGILAGAITAAIVDN